jgi:hypothetical protein
MLLPCYGVVTEHTNSVSLTLANVCDGSFNDFNFKVSGYDSQKFKFTYDVSLAGLDCVFRITKPIQGTIYLDIPVTDITVATSNITWTISRTNIPPPGNYYGELLSYDAGTTNVYRSLAQGKLPVTWSLYLNETNYFQRSTTNAAVGQIYVHPNWVYPLYTTTNNINSLSNYVVLIDGRLQTNINITSNAYVAADTAVRSELTNTITAHITNIPPHVSASDRTNWDGKATLADVAAAGYLTNAASGDSNAVWGNISGTLADQLDLTSTVAKAASAVQSEVDPNWTGISNTVVYTNDSHLTDARTPLAHSQGYTTITDAPWISGYTETDSIATNLIAISSNHFESAKLNTNGSGAGLTGITAAQVGAVPTNDISVTNARPWNSPNYNTITNPPAIPSTNGLASTNWVIAQISGVITGATVTESSSASAVTTNAGVLSFNIRTNSSGGAVSYGTSDTTAYRGDWGVAVSNTATSALQPAGDGSQLTDVNATNASALDGIAAGSYARNDINNFFSSTSTQNFNDIVFWPYVGGGNLWRIKNNGNHLLFLFADSQYADFYNAGMVFSNSVTASSFNGSGAGLTAVNATNATAMGGRLTATWDGYITDLTNRVTLASNAFVAADVVINTDLTNRITLASNVAASANTTAGNAVPKVGGTMTGALTGTVLTANSYNFTNTTLMDCGTLGGTNGVFWTSNLTNYWLLFK